MIPQTENKQMFFCIAAHTQIVTGLIEHIGNVLLLSRYQKKKEANRQRQAQTKPMLEYFEPKGTATATIWNRDQEVAWIARVTRSADTRAH